MGSRPCGAAALLYYISSLILRRLFCIRSSNFTWLSRGISMATLDVALVGGGGCALAGRLAAARSDASRANDCPRLPGLNDCCSPVLPRKFEEGVCGCVVI